ncbi:dUTP pyrophosphatase [Blastomyces dermatitidis ER-3]|uniref:Deoxyuridine 5'-triphosphate nucleotidohydrolase n=2 Tax=Blastomyces TaxID=229219 RepID=A0A179ULU8_BLAGS|nr:dUTP pyrophosphatase [Blastomyces gilchristii SLH14081]XP_045273963.1 dUTP pyrophosphatase [Blastomyces dermatitidis ER-3]EEQ86404.2 dUTP pyrophosphatase [Blastomyces dermatitidis ER-3]EQL30704.1 dUTP pyrophosphatase [Blastomyces dermatitidis ATCC 26199]OAT08860.1 dUTP pyrophosphatase [Blastomyces gilchristii SLH14081]
MQPVLRRARTTFFNLYFRSLTPLRNNHSLPGSNINWSKPTFSRSPNPEDRHTMTKEATPPPPATTTRQPPSLPNSPIAKRPKTTATMAPAAESAAAPAPAPSESTTTPSATPAVTSLSQSKAPPLLVKKLVPTARVPTRGSAFAAGYDLYCAKPIVIPAKGKDLVNTGLAIAVPEGTYGRIAPRSGLASKHFIDTGAGVIDADYRGEVKVLLFNFSDTDFTINEGDRIAQLVLERIYTPEVVEVEQLEESVRGAGGFGSTG